MAYHHTTLSQGSDIAHGVLNSLKAFFSKVGGAMISVAEANQRVRAVERLNEKSDAELAKMGIRREDIVRHVFRDMLHL
ncbi:MAG: DUF1127 domain-containing protein [Roseobacter sp.]